MTTLQPTLSSTKTRQTATRLYMLYRIGLNLTYMFLWVVAQTTFIDTYGISRWPLIFAGGHLLSWVTFKWWPRLQQYLPLFQYHLASLLLWLVGILAFWLMRAYTATQWPIVLLAIWTWGSGTWLYLLNQSLQALLSRIYPRRRWFLWSAGADAGGMLGGGVLVVILLQFVPPNVIIGYGMVGLAGAFLVFFFVDQNLSRWPLFNQFNQTQTITPLPLWPAWLKETTYHRRLLYFSISITLIHIWLEVWLVWATVNQWPDLMSQTAVLAFTWGILEAIPGLTGFIDNADFFRRLGVRKTILLFFVGSTLLGLIIIILAYLIFGQMSFMLWLALFASRIGEKFTRHITYKHIHQTVHQPLSTIARTQFDPWFQQRIKPLLATVTALILLILFMWAASPLSFIIGFSLIILISFITSLSLSRTYAPALLEWLNQTAIAQGELDLKDQDTRQALYEGLQSPHESVVIFSLEKLLEFNPDSVEGMWPSLLNHPQQTVRLTTLKQIETGQRLAILPQVQTRLRQEKIPSVQAEAVRVLASLGRGELQVQMVRYLADESPLIRQYAMIGLLESGDLEAILAAGTYLKQMIESEVATDRIFAAQVLETIGVSSFYQSLLRLLRDEHIPVRLAALRAAINMQNPHLWPYLLPALQTTATSSLAVAALAKGGNEALAIIEPIMIDEDIEMTYLISLIRVCSRIRTATAIQLLCHHINHPQELVRTETMQALYRCHYHAQGEAVTYIEFLIKQELALAIWYTAIWHDIQLQPESFILQSALTTGVDEARQRIIHLLSFIYDSDIITSAKEALTCGIEEKEQLAWTSLELVLPAPIQPLLAPILKDLSMAERYQALQFVSVQQPKAVNEHLRLIMIALERDIDGWIQACAVHVAGLLQWPDLKTAVWSARASQHSMVAETAEWAAHRWTAIPTKEKPMLSTIEKVIFLKSVPIFAHIPDRTLTQIAHSVTEESVAAGEPIFVKGDVGHSLYVVANGTVRVHDEVHTISSLGEREVFGEMAVLDPAPRMASVTAVTPARLLRLDRDPLHELMQAHTEVGWGIIQVLSRRLRDVTVPTMTETA